MCVCECDCVCVCVSRFIVAYYIWNITTTSVYPTTVAELVTGLVPGQNVQIVSLLAAQRTGAQQLTLQGNDPSGERESEKSVLAEYKLSLYGLLTYRCPAADRCDSCP